jgi:serine/threonine protein phosphatase PrpC
MDPIILGQYIHPGDRPVLEDYLAVEEIVTPGNLVLHVAMVADGVGGADRGEKASQEAVKAAMGYLRQSKQTDMPGLLEKAVHAAHQAVLARQFPDNTSTTLVMAAIVGGETLYVANVGDSRVYLVREGKLAQLTIDHTFANVMPWIDETMTHEQASQNSSAHVLVNLVGLDENIIVDTGFYDQTGDYEEAAKRGEKGYPLQKEDAILVCSDGFIRKDNGEPFIEAEKIVGELTRYTGDGLTRILVDFTLGSGTEDMDNIALVIVQVGVEPKAGPTVIVNKANRLPWVVVGGLVLLFLVVFALFLRDQGQDDEVSNQTATAAAAVAAFTSTAVREKEAAIAQTAEAANKIVETEAAIAQLTLIAASFTPTPSPTPSATPTIPPVPIAGEIGAYFDGSGRHPFVPEATIEVGDESIQVSLRHQTVAVDANFLSANIYGAPQSYFYFETSAEDSPRFEIRAGSHLLMWTGSYGSVAVTLADTEVRFSGRGACLSLEYPTEEQENREVAVACYQGACTFVTERGGGEQTLESGWQMSLNLQSLTTNARLIIPDQARRDRRLIRDTTDNLEDERQCGFSNYIPTVTPTLTPTTTSIPDPTATMMASPVSNNNPTATFIPPAPPTATFTPPAPPTATFTPPAPPTATFTPPAPPTATFTPPAPPTATFTPPAPPTATFTPPVPPTATFTPPVPPTATFTPPVPPTETFTPLVPPTAAFTPLPQSPNNASLPVSSGLSTLCFNCRVLRQAGRSTIIGLAIP